MKKIGIIGAGFMGTMTAVQLIKKTTKPLEIIFINDQDNFAKGIAYNPYSKRQLLNVVASKMSAFPELPDHFLDYLMTTDSYKNKNRDLVSAAFIPRAYYGDYLLQIWKNAEKEAKDKNIKITTINSTIEDIGKKDKQIVLALDTEQTILVDKCVLASGNQLPRNPAIRNMAFYESENYFQNPWSKESVTDVNDNFPVLILGNGLTMVDTIIGLLENGFKNTIYSISPNGYNILPHRLGGTTYPNLTKELDENLSLKDLVSLFNKHIKSVRELGLTAEPIMDSFRSHTQQIWRRLSEEDKIKFMNRLRHLWGVARHRIPLQIHDKIQNLRINRRLNVISGSIIDINENNTSIKVDFRDKKTKQTKSIVVGRIINCTGPETNLENLGDSFLNRLLEKGVLTQDSLKLGIKTNLETFQVIDVKGREVDNFYTAGSNLKGELWESTAVNELRGQAISLADEILK